MATAAVGLPWRSGVRSRFATWCGIPAERPRALRVAVLGGGVMGLTVATLLKEMRLDVRMYAKSFTDTVSDIAGGQWSPSLMEYERTVPGKERFERILCRAFHGYKAMIDKGYGVSERPNYVNKKTDGFKKIPESLIKPEFVPSLPFEGHNGLSGWRYDTLLIEPPTFLGRLRRDLADQAVPRNQQTFSSPSQVSGLPRGYRRQLHRAADRAASGRTPN